MTFFVPQMTYFYEMTSFHAYPFLDFLFMPGPCVRGGEGKRGGGTKKSNLRHEKKLFSSDVMTSWEQRFLATKIIFYIAEILKLEIQ